MPTRIPKIGDLFEQRYQLLSILGAGGIGTVFKAKQLDADRLIALKILHPQIVVDEEFKVRFLREAQALGKLSHPNIVTVYHMGVSQEGLPYLVMELINGRALRAILNEDNALQPVRVFKIMKQLISAIACIHAAGIVHRDIKPDNIVLMNEPENDFVKIIDFGLVKMDSNLGEQKLTSTGILIGSLNYMSPEQCQGKPAEFRSDLYSLSVCLHEMPAGSPPFFADSAVGLIYKHASAEPPQLKLQTGQMINPLVADFVRKGLEKEPSKRFQSAAEMDAELAQLTEIFTNESIASRTKLFQSIPKALIILVTGGVILAAAGALYQKNKLQTEHELSHAAKNNGKQSELSEYISEVVSRRGSKKRKIEDLLQVCENHTGTPYDLKAARAAFKIGEGSSDPEIIDLSCRARLRLAEDECRSGNYKEAIKIVAPLLKINTRTNPEGAGSNQIQAAGGNPRQIQEAEALAARAYQLSGNSAQAILLVREIINTNNEIFGNASIYSLEVLIANHLPHEAAPLLQKTQGFTALSHASIICRQAKQFDLAAIAISRAKSVLLEPRIDKRGIADDEIRTECEEVFVDCATGKQTEARQILKNILANSEDKKALHSGLSDINVNVILALRSAEMTDQALDLINTSPISGMRKNILEADVLIAAKRFNDAKKLLGPTETIADPQTGKRRLALEVLDDIKSGKYDYHRAFLRTDLY